MLNSVANLRPFFFNYARKFAYVKKFVYLCTQFVCKVKRQSLNNINMADIQHLATLTEEDISRLTLAHHKEHGTKLPACLRGIEWQK